MKHASIIAAAALIILANSLALLHVARNRSGEAEAEFVLCDRELTYDRDHDDSGVALRLRWLDPATATYLWALKKQDRDARWLDKTKLAELGFDCSVAPSDPKAGSFYERQIPRTGFVALEYDGSAWQSWLELHRQNAQGQQMLPGQDPDYRRRSSSRLVVIDAAGAAASLRSRHPDRSRVLIVPAVISISFVPASRATAESPERPARLDGQVRQISWYIHVPRPFSEGFRALPETSRDEKREKPLYRVRLRFGSLLEPWVTGVDFVD